MENHNPQSIVLKRGQTIGLVMSCVVTQEEQGHSLIENSDATQSVTGKSNDTENCVGGASGRRAEKEGQTANSVQSIENRNFYETEEERV